ncbi:MAG: hypothetical protein HGA87_04240 [Desulfobulbaceae bacterium]|nr:hypothetical protein [Desulfobulbaceae bacterium]
MNNVRGQRWRVSSPKTVSVSTFRSIVESLVDFMPGLETTKRSLRARAIADGQLRDLEGEDCWKVYQPFVLLKIEHLQIELTLHKNETSSCELHVEFQKNHIFLSVSDIGTGWRDAVFEEAERKLKSFGLFKGEWLNKLTYTISRLQNVFLVLGAGLLISPPNTKINLTYFAISLLATGIIPIIGDIFRLYFPKKPAFVLEERVPFHLVSIEKAALWIGIISGMVTLLKEFISLLNGAGN